MNVDGIIKLLSPILPKNTADDEPHGAIALLAVFDGICSGIYSENRIYFDSDFKNLFSKYFIEYSREQDRNRPLALFFHLRSCLLWKLMPLTGKEDDLATTKTVGSPRDLFKLVDYAYLDDELFSLLKNEKEICLLLQQTIINSLTPSAIRPKSRALKIPSKFPHEQKALEAIIPPLEKQIQFVSNFELHDAATNEYLECDLIAICSSCIVIIELKHWAGEIDISPNNWQVNGKYRPDPHKVNNFKCKVLKSNLDKAFPYLNIPWVESVVTLTNPDAIVYNYSLPKKSSKNPTFSSIDGLVQYLKYRMSTEGKVLGPHDRGKISSALWDLNEGPKTKGLQIPGYELLENITQSPERSEFLARVKGFDELQSVKRLRVFIPDPDLSSDERETQRIKAQNTLKALDQAVTHPNLLSVSPVPNDDSLVIEVSDWSAEGTLADVLYLQKKFTIEESVAIIQGIVAGLLVLHDKMVVHRDLRPVNILMDGTTPILMNFDYTYIPDDHSPEYTVFPDPDSLNASPFIAPELYTDGEFSEATDLFSVGVIFYTLLCGEPPFLKSLDLIDFEDGRLTETRIACLKDNGANDAMISLIQSLVVFDRTERPQEASDVKQTVEELLKEPTDHVEKTPTPLKNSPLKPGDASGVYEIEQSLGVGSEAQVYLARKIGDQRVALKLFFHEVPKDRVVNERNHLAVVKSPYILHEYGINEWQDKRLFLETNYIDGVSLRSLIKENKLPSVDEFRHVASCLLSALKAMHHDPSRDKQLLHNDIKPDNILISNTKFHDPVLIDFGASSYPHIGLYQGTDYYVAPDLLRKIDFDFCESGDLFAFGVTLFEWLCGCRPYEGVPSMGSDLKSVNDVRKDEFPQRLVEWLDQAVQQRQESRFGNVLLMEEAFEAIWKEEETETPSPEEMSISLAEESIPDATDEQGQDETGTCRKNDFVYYLNTLHNATAVDDGALAETQALSEYFGQIHVQLSQTEYIFKQLTEETGSHVILTGHAGDGKSTIGLELYKKLKNIPQNNPLISSLKAHEEISYQNTIIHIIKDMSELSSEEKTTTLEAALAAGDSERWLIISNTGTLLATFKSIAETENEQWAPIENDILSALNSNDPLTLPILDTYFSLINLAKTDNVQTALNVLHRIIEHDGWGPCNYCNSQLSCPINMNILTLLSTIEIAIKRIAWIYRRLKEYGVRLTMRQLTGHLAYSLTGGLDCKQVHEQAIAPMPPDQLDSFFANNFFGYTASGIDMQASRMKAIQHIRELEMGSKPYPALDRVLWTQESDLLPAVPESLELIVRPLQAKLNDKPSNSSNLGTRYIRQSIRRLYYIFAEFPKNMSGFIPQFLGSQMLLETENWQNGSGPQSMPKKQLLRKILYVLQEEFTGFQLSENHKGNSLYITLRRRSEGYRQSVQLLLAEIPISTFTLSWDAMNELFTPKRFIFTLREQRSQRELQLDLPFLDFVLMRDMGEVGQRLHPGYRDRVERFKAQLLDFSEYKKEELVLLEMTKDGELKTKSLEIHDEKLQVTL